MTGIEVAVGFLVAWAVRKAKRVGQRADAEVDEALDAGLDRLHDFVYRRLEGDTAVRKLPAEAEQTGHVSDRTRERVQDALRDTVAADPAFGAQLDDLVRQLQELTARSGGPTAALAAEHGVAVAGDVSIRAEGGSVAAWQLGNVSIGGQPPDPRRPGQPTG